MLDDGSLQLVEDNSAGSGSGETPTGETPTTESPERQRRAFSFLTPMDSSMLPPLPSDVDAVVFSWFATANVSSAFFCLERERERGRGRENGLKSVCVCVWFLL